MGPRFIDGVNTVVQYEGESMSWEIKLNVWYAIDMNVVASGIFRLLCQFI